MIRLYHLVVDSVSVVRKETSEEVGDEGKRHQIKYKYTKTKIILQGKCAFFDPGKFALFDPCKCPMFWANVSQKKPGIFRASVPFLTTANETSANE